jgi:predicted RecA/RadA family phage recombinase
MADIGVTAGRVRLQDVIEARLIPMLAGEEIAEGQAVYRMADGRAGLARGNAVGTAKVVGIARRGARAGTAFEALYHGRLQGFELDAITAGATVYLSAATAGALADTAPGTAGQVRVAVGTVHVMTDVGATPFLMVDIPQNGDPVAIA